VKRLKEVILENLLIARSVIKTYSKNLVNLLLIFTMI